MRAGPDYSRAVEEVQSAIVREWSLRGLTGDLWSERTRELSESAARVALDHPRCAAS